MLRTGLQLAFLDPLHDVGQGGVRRCIDSDFLGLSDDEPVQELDLGAAALDHVLPHRRAMRAAAGLVGFLEAMGVVFLGCRCVAFTGARDDLGVDMVDLLQLIAERLTDPDRFAAEPCTEAAEYIKKKATKNITSDAMNRVMP